MLQEGIGILSTKYLKIDLEALTFPCKSACEPMINLILDLCFDHRLTVKRQFSRGFDTAVTAHLL